MRFDLVGMRLIAEVFGNAVIDAFMVERHSLVGASIVRVDLGIRYSIVSDEALQGFLVGGRNHLRVHLVRLAVLRDDHGDLPDASAFEFLALGKAHVLSLAAEISLVNFDWSREWREEILVVGRRLKDALRDVPSRLLRHFQVAAQLH